ncbi:MAG TPA: hypothetical protein VF868_13010 [Bacteroidia bacterium]|jgi:hypothetical protein
MIRKLHFKKQDEPQNAKVQSVIGGHLDLVKIRTIEVKCPNPSELTFLIDNRAVGGARKKIISLADYRTNFISQNGVYILDTKYIPEFNDPEAWIEMKFSFRTIDKSEPIDIEVFYNLVQ